MGFTWPWYKDIQKVRTELEARMTSAEERLTAVNTRLDKVFDELSGLPDLIAQLRSELEAQGVSSATLDQVEAKVGRIDELTPDAETPPDQPVPNPDEPTAP